ncbi:hypothetical protein PVK06_002704 [Gossypium arboreum]|uniref:Uncharacterized protein n=1 Tax=Gossypium arboreum TaxID=29729 RepID=A0ABR0R498_GOSAR|nr:hypothetical protein PVK06_002704 [Gossypium arboreum]
MAMRNWEMDTHGNQAYQNLDEEVANPDLEVFDTTTPCVAPSSSKDPLELPQGSITRARTKQFKEAISALVNQVWARHWLDILRKLGLAQQDHLATSCKPNSA